MKRYEDIGKEIMLFGYGKFGKHLYEHLRDSGYRVRVATMITANHEDALRDEIEDIQIFNPKHNDSIYSLGINPARHLLYCAMDRTSNNLFLVLSLRELYHDATIVVISNSDENTRKLRYAGADTIINIYDSSAQYIITSLAKPAVSEAINTIVFEKNDLKIAEILMEAGTPFEGKRTAQVDFHVRGLILIAIIDKELGDELVYLSKGIDHKIDAGDTLVLAGTTDAVNAFRKELV